VTLPTACPKPRYAELFAGAGGLSLGLDRAGFECAWHAEIADFPRRLMPIECERLMGWPDFWTDVPDEKGRPASDAARYKACGNGVVSHCVQWIGERLRGAA
jgi:site-specific DNA-cytosine methylase